MSSIKLAFAIAMATGGASAFQQQKQQQCIPIGNTVPHYYCRLPPPHHDPPKRISTSISSCSDDDDIMNTASVNVICNRTEKMEGKNDRNNVVDAKKEKDVSEHKNQPLYRTEEEEVLSCRILGFYPFPTPPPKGILGWMLRDTHQAILVESISYPSYSIIDDVDSGNECAALHKHNNERQRRSRRRKRAVLLDFMTKDGEFHPVWYDEATKWNVMLGSSIKGEVRIRNLGGKT